MTTEQTGWTAIDAGDSRVSYTPSVSSSSPFSCGRPSTAKPPAADSACLNKWMIFGSRPFPISLPASSHTALVPSNVAVSLKFNGTGVRVSGGALFNGGNGTVSIDGKEDGTPVQFVSNFTSAVVFTREDLARDNQHTLKFTFAKSPQGVIRIDGFEIFTGDPANPSSTTMISSSQGSSATTPQTNGLPVTSETSAMTTGMSKGHRILALEITLPLVVVLLAGFALCIYLLRRRHRRRDAKGGPLPYAVRDTENRSPVPTPSTSTKEQILSAKPPPSTMSSSLAVTSASSADPDQDLVELGVAMRQAGLTVHGLLAALHPGQNTSQRPPDYHE